MSQIANYFVLKRFLKNTLRHDMFNDFLRRYSMTSLSLHGLSYYNPQAAQNQHIFVLINSNNSNF